MDLNELDEVAQDKHADLIPKEKPVMKNNLKQDQDINEESKAEVATIADTEAMTEASVNESIQDSNVKE